MTNTLTHNEKVQILSRLVRAAARIGHRFEHIEDEYDPHKQLPNMIGYTGLEDQHQGNRFDDTSYALSLDVIDDIFGRKAGQNPFGKPFNTRFQHKKKVIRATEQT